MENQTKQIDYSKARLAELCGVGPSTARRYCNVMYLNDLKELGYYTTQKKFTPKQWHFLQERLDF